jgi:hypothetical protein
VPPPKYMWAADCLFGYSKADRNTREAHAAIWNVAASYLLQPRRGSFLTNGLVTRELDPAASPSVLRLAVPCSKPDEAPSQNAPVRISAA